MRLILLLYLITGAYATIPGDAFCNGPGGPVEGNDCDSNACAPCCVSNTQLAICQRSGALGLSGGGKWSITNCGCVFDTSNGYAVCDNCATNPDASFCVTDTSR